MFRNYTLLNPLTHIFNFATNSYSLKRKSMSDINIRPSKQKAYAPTGFGDSERTELETKYSVSSETVFKEQKTNELDKDDFAIATMVNNKLSAGHLGDNNDSKNEKNQLTITSAEATGSGTSSNTSEITETQSTENTEVIESTTETETTESAESAETVSLTETITNESNELSEIIEMDETLVFDTDNLPKVEDVLNLLENKDEVMEAEKEKRKNYEYLLGKQYSILNEHDLPRIKIKTSDDFHHRAHAAFKQHCTKVFDDPQVYDINSIEDIWGKMSVCRKFPYYWLAANCQQLSKNAFENYLNFHNRLPKNNTKSTNMQSLLNSWKKMSYDEKLPFIFETFLVHISAAPKLFKEHNMQLFFEMERRKH